MRNVEIYTRCIAACPLLHRIWAYLNSLCARWPIRKPRPTCGDQDAWVVIESKGEFYLPLAIVRDMAEGWYFDEVISEEG